MRQTPESKKYRFDFALITLTGNVTRYKILRPLVEKDATILPRWFPIRTWFEGDPLAFLPGAIRLRARHLLDTWRLYLPSRSDAILIHAFETYYLYALMQRLMRRSVVIVKNPDGALPSSGRKGFSGEGKFHLAVKYTDLIVLWSRYGLETSKQIFPELPDEKVHILHPGLNLDQWPMRTPPCRGERFQILFVGGDLLRKGGDTLVEAFEQGLSAHCDLHIATHSGYLPPELKTRMEQNPHITLYLDLAAGSEAVQTLFRTCDVFVLPTNSDFSPWVALEAMATGLPVIITPVGGVPDMVIDGETGLLIPPKSPDALIAAVERLRLDSDLYDALVRQGRLHVETNFNAVKNTKRLLDLMKTAVDNKRRGKQAIAANQ